MSEPKTEPFSRRRFLKRLTILGGGALLLSAASRAQAAQDWAPIGPASKFRPGRFTHIVLPDVYNGNEIYVTQDDHGGYLALSARCTHKGCLVDWNEKRKQFQCPCHGGRFDETGKNVGGPPPRPLAALTTRVDEQGILSVQVPRP